MSGYLYIQISYTHHTHIYYVIMCCNCSSWNCNRDYFSNNCVSQPWSNWKVYFWRYWI